MKNIDVLLKEYNLTRYRIAEVSPYATQQRLSVANDKNVDKYKVDIIIALSEGITQLTGEKKTPGEILDSLINIQKNRKEELEMDKIKELQADLERANRQESITIWNNKVEFFENLRQNNEPGVEWEEMFKDSLGNFSNEEPVIECENGNGEPTYFTVNDFTDIYDYFK